MNNQNRHMRYRRSVYRRRRIKITVIVSICAIILLTVAFVIIGNLLGNRTDTDTPGGNDAPADADTPDNASTVKSVNSCFVPLAEDGSTLGERLSSATSAGYTDVCFDLDNEGGYLYYQSEIASTLGKQKNAADDLRTLSGIISLTSSRSLYCTGITHVPDFRNDDDLVRSAAIGYHAALIAEALRAGIDDVLIMPGDIDAQRYDELIRLADEVHRLEPMAHIGLALPAPLFSSEENTELIHRLTMAFDYLAVEISADTDMSGLLYYMLRYNVRALVPDAEGAERVKEYTKNIQIMA